MKNENLNAPDIAIIGVPKAGTSSVHEWLATFPEVVDSNPKETFFFIDKDCPMKNAKCNFHDHGFDAYNSFFDVQEDSLRLDSTTHYLYQDTAREVFSKAGTTVLAIIRDPVKRVVSYFQYLAITKSLAKKSLQFDIYVDHLLAGKMENMRGDIFGAMNYHALAESLEHGVYANYIPTWKKQFPVEKFKVVLFEDLLANRNEVLTAIGQHFGLSPTQEQLNNLPRSNKTLGVRFAGLNRLARNLGHLIPGEKLKDTLRSVYLNAQTKDIPDFYQLYPRSIEKLVEFFEPENRRLADESQINLSRWLTTESLRS